MPATETRRAWVAKSPEENHGVLVTASNSALIRWIRDSGRFQEVGRILLRRDRLASRKDSFLPDDEYKEHLDLARSTFPSRAVKREKKQRALEGQARMDI